MHRVAAVAAVLSCAAASGRFLELPRDEKLGFRVDIEAKTAEKSMRIAHHDENEAMKLKDADRQAVEEAKSEFFIAKEASIAAFTAMKEAESLRDQVKIATLEAARNEIADVVKHTVKAAHDEAKVAAVIEAKETKAKMLAEAPKAGKKAMEPYTKALNDAVATAGVFQKKGDGVVGVATGFQMDAQNLLVQAQTFQSLGQVAQAQTKIQEAHSLQNAAVGLMGTAQGFYNTASKIMGGVGEYANEAVAASYHAEVMLNPDKPPPPPPLI